MGRREQRESIFHLLFMTEFNPSEEIPEQKQMYLDNIEELQEKDQSYIQNKFENIREKITEIDEILNQCSKGWKTSRMAKVDLSIIRIAVYEIKFEDDIPFKVSVNEAVELAKKYGADESPAFVNGILAKFA